MMRAYSQKHVSITPGRLVLSATIKHRTVNPQDPTDMVEVKSDKDSSLEFEYSIFWDTLEGSLDGGPKMTICCDQSGKPDWKPFLSDEDQGDPRGLPEYRLWLISETIGGIEDLDNELLEPEEDYGCPNG